MRNLSESSSKQIDVRKMTIIGVLSAICIVLGTTPLGFIPIGPTKATIMHIPVLIGAILEGPVVGMAIGLIFGLFSIFNALTNPGPVSFVFLNPIVSILPRVIMGFVAYKVYDFFDKKNSKLTKTLINAVLLGLAGYLLNSIRINNLNTLSIILNLIFVAIIGMLAYYINKQDKEVIALTLGAAAGTLTNTVGVLSSIYFIYGERYVATLGESANLARKIIFGIAVTNGIPELILGIVITASVVGAIKKTR